MKNMVFIITVISLFMSCSIKNSFISNIKTYGYVDLQEFIKDEFDYVLIVDEGNYISNIITNINNDTDFWLGQKIYFVKNDFIVKQINVEYYVSKPEMDYISFFLKHNIKENYIKRYRGDTVFKCIEIQSISGGFKCYYLE